jgi:hypothetical protein
MKISYTDPKKFILVLAVSIIIVWVVTGNASEKWDAKASVRVNLRRYPNPNSVILSIVPKTHKLRIMEKKGAWWKVDVEGKIHGKGWVYAEYIEEILPAVLKTESSSQTVRVEIASREQKQGIHPSELPANARTKGAEVKPFTNLSKMEIPMIGEPAHIAPSQVTTEVRTVDEKTKPLKTILPVKVSMVSLNKQVSARNKLQDAKNESNVLSKVEIPTAGETGHVPPFQPLYSDFKQEALGISGKYFSGVIEQGDSSTYQKSLNGENKKHGGALQGTPHAVNEQSVSDVRILASSAIRSVVSHERKGLINKRELMGPVVIALKFLSIMLSCLVILLLYKKIDAKL